MAPSESTILQNYLLLPARLPTIVSLQEFTSYFPKSQQSSTQIRTLYRDLQQQRNAVVDTVASNIDSQVKQGKALRRAVVKARREAESEEGVDDEIEIERTVSLPAQLLAKEFTLCPWVRPTSHED
jgi:centromere-localized protein 2